MAFPKQIMFKVGYVVKPDDERYVAHCPQLDGCFTWGYTFEEAEDNIRKLIPQFLGVLIRHGDPIPLGIVEAHSHREKGKPAEAVTFSDNFAVPCSV